MLGLRWVPGALLGLLLLGHLLAGHAAAAVVSFDWVPVGNPTNGCDPQPEGCFGFVDYAYEISKYEVTNAQYAEFLNAVATTDTFGLYDEAMGLLGGITRSGDSGAFRYAVVPGRAQQPVDWVSFYDALRFANWLENGQPDGAQDATTTEDGAYTFQGVILVGPRNPTARRVVPNRNEWYKAAYYDPGIRRFRALPFVWDFTGAVVSNCSTPPGTTNHAANCALRVGSLLDVGSYPGSPSPYGTFDQGGNVSEWIDAIAPGRFGLSERGIRGGNAFNSGIYAGSEPTARPDTGHRGVGFRVARVPIPVVRVGVDIRPGEFVNVLELSRPGIIEVAVLGSTSLDIESVDAFSLALGPNGASPVPEIAPYGEDVNYDGIVDLITGFRTEETGIGFGDTQACLTGELLDGRKLEGCDAIAVQTACGIGFELAFLLPPLLWLRRRWLGAGR